MDAQLDAARQLLSLASSIPDCYIHPAVCVRRDAYSGLGLFVRDAADAAARGISTPGCSRFIGIAPDELLIAIPRKMMIESVKEAACYSQSTSCSDDGAYEDEHASSSNIDLCHQMAQLVTCHKIGNDNQHLRQYFNPELLALYLGCIPDPQQLCSILPVLWALQPAVTHSNPQKHAPEAVERLQFLHHILQPSQSTLLSIQGQVAALLQLLGLTWNIRDMISGAIDCGHNAHHETPAAVSVGSQVKDLNLLLAWSLGLCWSRAIGLWSGPTLVPIVDLLNHCHPPNVMCRVRSHAYECEDPRVVEESVDNDSSTQAGEGVQRMEVIACQPLAPGAELHWVYLAHQHDAGWFSCYGFIPTDGASSHPDSKLRNWMGHQDDVVEAHSDEESYPENSEEAERQDHMFVHEPQGQHHEEHQEDSSGGGTCCQRGDVCATAANTKGMADDIRVCDSETQESCTHVLQSAVAQYKQSLLALSLHASTNGMPDGIHSSIMTLLLREQESLDLSR